jgi:uncharacterized protein YjbI with pentapeptide repeats
MRESTLIGAVVVMAWVSLGLAGAPAWAQLAAEPAVFHERDFAQNPALAAWPHDVVVLELEAVRRGRAMRQSLARYRLDVGTHTFCLDADDSHVTGLIVEDGAGRPILELHLPMHQRRSLVRSSVRGRCARTILPSGTYQVRVTHDGRLITGASGVAFMQAAPPSPSLVDAQGKPAAGWWALRPDPNLDPLGRRREGRVTLGPEQELARGVRPLVADFASKQIDDTSLFDVHDVRRPLVKASGGIPLDLAKVGSNPDLTLVADADPSRTQTFFHDTTPLVVTDLGQYRAQLGVRRADRRIASVFLGTAPASPTTFMLNYDQPRDPAPPAPVEVLFRFFPDGTQIGELQEGEIALFQECNYQGKAAVFAGRIPNLAELSSAVVTLGTTAASVKLGNNTGVILHTGPVYTGTKRIVELDTPCLDTPLRNNAASLEVQLLAPTILFSTRSCVGCKLVGADLSGRDLSEINLEKADLTRANLTGSILLTPGPGGSILESVKLANATLDEAIGFAGTDHSLLDLSNTSLKRVDFSHALLYGTKLNGANLEGANLSGAVLTNHPSPVGPPAPPPRQHPDIKDAASLSGAYLKNVNLSNAQLSGADFSNASFYGDNAAADQGCDTSRGFLNGCASAKSATMNTTNFSGAYLYGVDFQGATTHGVQFANAVLVGASFAGALARDPNPNLGTLTRFTAAFLQGAKIREATTIDQVSFVDAFVDFRAGGNNLTLLLDGTHTAFHGWKAPGRRVIVQTAQLHQRVGVVPPGGRVMHIPGCMVSRGRHVTAVVATVISATMFR